MDAVRIGLVGSGFMARAHTMAYNNAPAVYWPGLPTVEKVRLADIDDALARGAADRWGWRDATVDWRRVTQADDVDLVDIVTPNDLHAEIAIDAARHGKHILCEKPLAHTAAAAAEMYRAVLDADVINQVNFIYRKWPAVMLARQLIERGELGRIMHFRAYFLQDYALDASLPRGWRMQRDRSGGGSLGDVGSHLVDLARYLVGEEIARVFARTKTFIGRRPPVPSLGEAAFQSGASPASHELLPVDVDDAADVIFDFDSGAIGVLQTNWVASGHKIDLGFEVGGDKGSVRFSWQHGNELEVFLNTEAGDDLHGYRTVILGPNHPGGAEFWPVPGQGLGYSDAFLIACRDLFTALRDRTPATPDFLDGLRACEVVEAALRSDELREWVDVPRFDAADLAPAGDHASTS
jgi:levoglucosan dehydrogenase